MTSEFSDNDFSTANPAEEPSWADVTRINHGGTEAKPDDAAEDAEFELGDPQLESDPTCHQVLGDYLLLEPIGAGGMGQVYRAQHRTMDREVALKVLSQRIASKPYLLEQFFAEIRAVAKLMHPNIVTAFDAGSQEAVHYLVMELVRGQVVYSLVRRQGPLGTQMCVNLLTQAARALEYAHSQGIVHRDIKPGNMMLAEGGTLKILDFGLARFGAPKESPEEACKFMGTPEYMSPEQIEHADSVDGRSDLYSLGASLFFWLTGRPMFQGEPNQVARAQLRSQPTPLFMARSDVDLRLDAVFQRLTHKQPDDRYANATELLAELATLNLTEPTAEKGLLSKGGYRLEGDSPTSVATDHTTLARKSQVVAIDLGVVTTTAAVYNQETGPQLVALGQGAASSMRNMIWSREGELKLGAEAVELRKADPEHMLHSIQRRFGLTEFPKPFAGQNVPPEVPLAALLSHTMHRASSMSEGSSSAIVTVPSCYDQMHRRAIRNACRIAGIELVQLLDKPLAAALSWLDVNMHLQSANGGGTTPTRLLVVHLGGSGLEASVVQVADRQAKQLGSCGHWKLGLQRWQALLTEYFAGRLLQNSGLNIRQDVAAATRLQRTVELAIDRLTRTSKVDVRFEWRDQIIEQTVTQEGLVKIAPDLSAALEQSIRKAVATAGLELEEIDQVLLAGSMMNMRPVRRVVKQLLPEGTGFTLLDKGEFARGAAIQARHAATLSSESRQLPHAVACTSYDFAALTSGSADARKPTVVLPKGTAVPAAQTIDLPGFKTEDATALPVIQMIESSSLGGNSWLKLGKLGVADAFGEQLLAREQAADGSIKLRLEIDESGIMDACLAWPAGNQMRPLPASSDPNLSEDQAKHWHDWLSTLLLCSE